MLSTLKKWIGWALFAWVLGVLVTGILVPRFQKKPVEGQTVQITGEENRPEERVLSVDDNMDALLYRLEMIEAAEDRIILSTYCLGNDESGRDVMSSLLQAADRGVDIRILVDGFCSFINLRSSEAFKALTEHENIEARIYNPVNFLMPWRLNYRMHDKYLIVDDSMYILGGRNTRNVSLGDNPGKHDMDRDMLVLSSEAGSLHQLTDYFEQVWELPVSKPVRESSRPHAEAAQKLRDRYQALQKRYPEAFSDPDFSALTIPVKSVNLLTNPVEAGRKVPTLWSAVTEYMWTGQEILVETPYIICNRMMYDNLEILHREGKQITILTNAPEYGANPCGCADFLNNRRKLRNTGAEIWEYGGGRSSHTKTVLIDDNLSIVGSFNYDMRSTYLDTETMLVIESEELNSQLRQQYEARLLESRHTEADGTVIKGEKYNQPPVGLLRKLLYAVLRIVILPVRHLL